MQPTSSFRLAFHRHDPKCGDTRIMIEHITAIDFDDAMRSARFMINAMRVTDTERTYRIVSISNEGLRGIITASGWMTEDELCAKIAQEKAEKK